MSLTLRSTSPACAARSATSFSSAGERGSFAGFLTARAPSSSPTCSTGNAPSISLGTDPSTSRIASRTPASGGHVATSRNSSSTASQTSARSAPTPSPSTRTMRVSTSSSAYAPPTRSENSESTSYGVARFPYTSRSASRVRRARTGWNVTATMTAAISVSAELPRPNQAPRPTTTPRYTSVAKIGERRVQHGLPDDEIEVVQVEPQHGHGDRDGEGGEREGRRRSRSTPGLRSLEGQRAEEREEGAEGDPFDLLAFDAGRPAEPDEEGDDPEREEPDERHEHVGVEGGQVAQGRHVQGVLDPGQAGGSGYDCSPITRATARNVMDPISTHSTGRHRGEGACPSGKTSGSRNTTDRAPYNHPSGS